MTWPSAYASSRPSFAEARASMRTPATANPSGHGFGASLRKPFTNDELQGAIGRALD
jgi:hypothetical protein